MAIDFPNSPTIGDTFTVDNRTWTWDGTSWDLAITSINPIEKTIVDAKGDLVGASASDTPARIPVGSNGTFLVADSVQTAGVGWSNPGEEASSVMSFGTFA